jgi:hypothetical protein
VPKGKLFGDFAMHPPLLRIEANLRFEGVGMMFGVIGAIQREVPNVGCLAL